MINISYFYNLLGSMCNRCGWPPADLYFVSMPARTAVLPNANFGLSDLIGSVMFIYVSGIYDTVIRLTECHNSFHIICVYCNSTVLIFVIQLEW